MTPEDMRELAKWHEEVAKNALLAPTKQKHARSAAIIRFAIKVLETAPLFKSGKTGVGLDISPAQWREIDALPAGAEFFVKPTFGDDNDNQS